MNEEFKKVQRFTRLKQELAQPISPLLMVLVVVFVAFLIMSNILANNMLQIGPWASDAGNLTFPITYILSDVFSEVYGYKWSRRVTFMAAGLNFIFALLIMLSIGLPHPDFFDASHFAMGIGSSMRIVLASIICFVSGDFVNDRVFRRMKLRHKGIEGFKSRAFVSSVAGQIVDTTLFCVLAFAGTMPFIDVLSMIPVTVVIKVAYELLILPITHKIVKIVRAKEEQLQK